MTGLQKLCKLYGRMKINETMWIWDYANGKPRIESEMTKEEITASEKEKWNIIKTK